jgi:hypothetical protein
VVSGPVAGCVPASCSHRPTATFGRVFLPELSGVADSGVLLGLPASGGGYSSRFAISPVKSSSSFVFSHLPALELPPPVLASQLVSYGFFGRSCGAEFPAFVPPPLSGAPELGEKIRSSLLMLFNSKPFWYRRAREIRAGHSVKWNDRLLSDSLEASKMAAGAFEGAVLSLLLLAESEPVFSDLESGYSDGSGVDDAFLPNSHGSDIPLLISSAKMGEKLTLE